MTYPTWIDPTPITRAFVGSFANAPMREPFAHLRRKMLTGLTFADSRVLGSQRGAQALKSKAEADAAARGETMIERHKRQRQEYYQRKKEYYASYYRERRAKLASGSNALRVGVKGEESSSPSVKP